ncbi:unnamed protein product [Toxocara canis]|uniref:Secreted protein n=1 Tax=Toxocara canis TaxID=6265 RepID=A0A183UGG6_TOXCA|nr:unnamed protein product [Toxocara canis]
MCGVRCVYGTCIVCGVRVSAAVTSGVWCPCVVSRDECVFVRVWCVVCVACVWRVVHTVCVRFVLVV